MKENAKKSGKFLDETERITGKALRGTRGFLTEFREFATKGNIMDLAVGVILGGAFGKIITSLVNDIIMPLVSAVFGKGQFTDLSLTLREATETSGAVVFTYGAFIQNIVDFILVAFCVFLFIKTLNGLRTSFFRAQAEKEKAEKEKAEREKKEAEAKAAAREEAVLEAVALLREIRDASKNKG